MERIKFDPNAIGKRIRQLRHERGLGRNEFALQIGCSTGSCVTWWERGDRLPSAVYLFSIAQACNVSVDWLLGLTEERRKLDLER